jgi:hypothetical protein
MQAGADRPGDHPESGPGERNASVPFSQSLRNAKFLLGYSWWRGLGGCHIWFGSLFDVTVQVRLEQRVTFMF